MPKEIILNLAIFHPGCTLESPGQLFENSNACLSQINRITMQRPKGMGQSMREGQASVWSEFPREDPDHCCRGISHRPSGAFSGDTIASVCDPVPDPRVSSPSPKQMGSTLHVHISAQWTKGQIGGKRAQNNILSDICNDSKPGDFTHCLSLTQSLPNCIRTHHIIPHPGKCEPTVLVVK